MISAHQNDLICAAASISNSNRCPDQNGRSARHYPRGFAWLVGVVMGQRAIARPACLFIGAFGVNFRF
jgi:hypothetical protein